MNKIKSITDNDQRKLVCELCLLYFVQTKERQATTICWSVFKAGKSDQVPLALEITIHSSLRLPSRQLT